MKKLIVLLLAIVLFAVPAVNGATVDFTVNSPVVNILDEKPDEKSTDVSPVFSDGVLFVPVRIAVESLGASVLWHDDERKVEITSDNVNVSFVVGEDDVIVNNATVKLDAPAGIIDNRTMVPLQFFEKCMNYTVREVGVSNQIILSDDMPVMRVDNSYINYDEVKLLFDIDKDKYKGEEELLVKSCISNLFDTAVMCNNASVKHNNFTDVEGAEILLKAEEDEHFYKDLSLKSIYTYVLSKRKVADKFSDWLSTESIPGDEEISQYFLQNYPGNKLSDELYEEIRYLLGYEKFVENWNKLYENTDDETFYEISVLTEMLK